MAEFLRRYAHARVSMLELSLLLYKFDSYRRDCQRWLLMWWLTHFKLCMMKNNDDFFEKTSKFAEQAEAKLKDAFEKAQKSETYAKITDAMEQVGEAVDKKIEEIKQGDLPGKVENLRDQAESKAETFIDHARAYGSILANDVDEVIDSLREKLSGNSNKK